MSNSYNAFISYSHRQDSDLAPSLEKALEKFAKPLFKKRALDIFRDQNDLSASPDLWGKIEEGLDKSEYFIFLASQAAAQSRWCKKEVEHWKTNKSIDNFLVVLTDGALIWDESKGDFDWKKTTAIPENLSGSFNNEPLYVDFRGEHSPEDLTLENPEFKTKLVLLAATLHKKPVGDMVGEGIRQHNRTKRITFSAIGVLIILLIASVLFGVLALEQKKEADKQTKIAQDSSESAQKQRDIANYQKQIAEDRLDSIINFMNKSVGKPYQGGIIFSADSTRERGLITTSYDLGQYSWEEAKKVCDEYLITIDGVTYDDWRLPTKEELAMIYQNRLTIGGFKSHGYYWSSTEGGLGNMFAWYMKGEDGYQAHSAKFHGNIARPVRSFKP